MTKGDEKMLDEVNQALYNLFQCRDIAMLATDIYWGNNNHFTEEEKNAFEDKDYDDAYHRACLEMIERVKYGNDFPYQTPEERADESPAWDKMVSGIADLYGKHLRLIQTEKTLKAGISNPSEEVTIK